MVQCPRPILHNIGFTVFHAFTPIFEDSQPKIDIIEANRITSRIMYIAVPINYLHAQYALLAIGHVRLNPTIQLYDIGTKTSTGTILKRHYSYIRGTR